MSLGEKSICLFNQPECLPANLAAALLWDRLPHSVPIGPVELCSSDSLFSPQVHVLTFREACCSGHCCVPPSRQPGLSGHQFPSRLESRRGRLADCEVLCECEGWGGGGQSSVPTGCAWLFQERGREGSHPPIRLSTHLLIHLSICLSFQFSIHPPIHLPNPYIHAFTHPPSPLSSQELLYKGLECPAQEFGNSLEVIGSHRCPWTPRPGLSSLLAALSPCVIDSPAPAVALGTAACGHLGIRHFGQIQWVFKLWVIEEAGRGGGGRDREGRGSSLPGPLPGRGLSPPRRLCGL